MTTTTPHMSYIRPLYGPHKQEIELLEQIYVVLLRLSTLLIVILDQVDICMHIFAIIIYCLPLIVWLSNHFIALLHSEQVLTGWGGYKYSYHGFLSWYLTPEEDEQTVVLSADICSICDNSDNIWWYEIHDIVHKYILNILIFIS